MNSPESISLSSTVSRVGSLCSIWRKSVSARIWRSVAPVIGVGVVLGTMGCSSPYWKDVSKDFGEVFEASVGVAEGVSGHARVTRVAQVGFGSCHGDWVGFKEGRFATWREERSEIGLSLLYVHDYFRWRTDDLVEFWSPIYGEEGYSTYPWDWNRLTDRGWFDIGARANIIHLGFDIAIKLDEFADFLASVGNVDLLGDDAFRPSYRDLVIQARSDNARQRYRAIRALRWRTGGRFGYEALTAPESLSDDQGRALVLWQNAALEGESGEP